MTGIDPTQVRDPHPKIQSALLHSGDLRAYAEDGLFDPFYAKGLKPASYEINLLGTVYWWPLDSGTLQKRELKKGDTLVIPQNGIVLICPIVEFKVPPFLALRFNLHIRLVHRGLLLGTGPLVDPGYEGRLLIPVHNLTDRSLTLNADEGFIWVEVTKVSPLTSNPQHYELFPTEKKNVPAEEYLRRASNLDPIRSSIPSISAEIANARAELDRYERRAFVASMIALVGVLIGFGSLAFSTYGIWRDTFQFISDAKTNLTTTALDEANKAGGMSQRVQTLEQEVAALKRDRKATK